MTEKKPSEMTPAERQDWAMRNIPLSDGSAPAETEVKPATQPVGSAQGGDIVFETMPDMPASPYVVIITGYLIVLIAGIGAGLLAEIEAGSVAVFIAIAVAVAGSIAVSVGTIGAGVRFGMRHSRWETERERRIEVARGL
ncbi:hypothetical protein [Nocardioides sp. AX2bis]|uniref:hypothetical protein n=1 Tax=Nocardioides sp. AX2bis TaxID=2653157 RepID=UPI0012F37A2A|nr:hypothetical protein [Nocardioides sp. AX2bis]VXB34273.1 hypothetical protein NOCARDAX2BIS_210089 [Nocardioides sp. AX2bis]